MAVILLPMGFWLSQQITVVQERVEVGASAEVRSNPYLAMEYFLQEQHISVQRLTRLRSIQPTTSSVHRLIRLKHADYLNNQQRTDPLPWVAQRRHPRLKG